MPQLLLRGATIGSIEGVLFDKDGTLSNSEPHLHSLAKERIHQATFLFKGGQANKEDLYQLHRLLASAYGIDSEGVNPEGTIAIASRKDNLISTATIFSLLGESWPQAMKIANEVFIAADQIEEKRSSHNKSRTLLPGAWEVLNQLREAKVRCALISNDTRKGIENFLSQNNLENKISHFWSADDLPAKPSPEAVHGLCTSLGLVPNQCALIGDADSDMRMARLAGIEITLGYISGWKKHPSLKEHQHLIHHWNDLAVMTTLKLS